MTPKISWLGRFIFFTRKLKTMVQQPCSQNDQYFKLKTWKQYDISARLNTNSFEYEVLKFLKRMVCGCFHVDSTHVLSYISHTYSAWVHSCVTCCKIVTCYTPWLPNFFAKTRRFHLDGCWMSHIAAHCKNIHFARVKFSYFFSALKVELLNYESGKRGRAVPRRGKFWEKYENETDVNQVSILCQVQVAGK